MRDSSVVLYKVQNTANGSFPISIFAHSTSCDDVTVQRAHDFYNIAKARHRHPDTVYTVNDFPTRDGASMMQHLCPHRGLNGSLTLPKDMNVVIVGNDESDCDHACTLLRNNLSTHDKVFFWDTEPVTYVTGQVTNELRCSLVQVCVSSTLTVLFHVTVWSNMFKSFQDLFQDSSIVKVAHYVQHDLSHLKSKFSTLQVTNTICFMKAYPELFPRGFSKGLAEVLRRVCGVHLNKRIDHTMWCVPGLMPGHINYSPWMSTPCSRCTTSTCKLPHETTHIYLCLTTPFLLKTTSVPTNKSKCLTAPVPCIVHHCLVKPL